MRQSSKLGMYGLEHRAGLFGFGRAMTVERCQVFGSLDLRKHDVENEHNQAVASTFWWMTNSGWKMLYLTSAFRCIAVLLYEVLEGINGPQKRAVNQYIHHSKSY